MTRRWNSLRRPATGRLVGTRLALESLDDRALPSGTLYFTTNFDAAGQLYTLDTATGAATLVPGVNTGTGSQLAYGALAESPIDGMLYGSSLQGLTIIRTDGSGTTTVGDVALQGLAFDRRAGVLYGSYGADFFTVNAATGTVLRSLPSPGEPIMGLSDGPDDSLFAVSVAGNLLNYDIKGASWTTVGNIGGSGDGAALAFDPESETLYLKRLVFDRQLYSVDLNTAALTAIGDTFMFGSGGMAFVPTESTGGVVDAVLSANGRLTLTGSPADNGLGLDLNRAGQTEIIGLGSTKLRVNGQVQQSARFSTEVKELFVSLGDGDDKIVLHPSAGFQLSGSATFDLGSGNNTLSLRSMGEFNIGGNLSIKAEDGDDIVELEPQNGFAPINGNFSMQMGNGNVGLSAFLVNVNGSGGFSYESGAGGDGVTIGAMKVARGGFQVRAGAGTLFGGLGGLTARGPMRITSGGDVNIVSAFMDVGGMHIESTTKGNAGIRHDDGDFTVRGNAVIRGGIARLVTPTAGMKMTVDGAFTMDGIVSSAQHQDLTVRRNFSVTSRQRSEVEARSLNVGQRISVRGDLASLTTTGGGTLSAKSVDIVAPVNARLDWQDTNANVAGDVRVQAGATATTAVTNPTGTMAVGRHWQVSGLVSAQAVFGGANADTQEIKGNVSVKSGPGIGQFLANSSLHIKGSVGVNFGDGQNVMSLGSGNGSLMKVDGSLFVRSKGADDTVALLGVRVGGTTNVSTGGGQDTLQISDGTEFIKAVTVDLGTGDDSLLVAHQAGANGTVRFGGKTTIRTMTGSDTARFGLSVAAGGDANSQVTFAIGRNLLDLGLGDDITDTSAYKINGVAPGALTILGMGSPITLP